ncbi:MAG: hypothetical protein KAT16_08835 [Candidatus Heimdallarchaeota archaeon]|nr:hypothetical protein [Candidatus Heimdallarchaeota archaeon]
MNDKEESTTKKLGRFLGKKAVEAGNIVNREMKKAGKIARDEISDVDFSNIVVKPSKRPNNESRVQFTRRARPTKTYAQANRTVQYFSRNPKEKEMDPGIDGLVSFSILITPMAVLIGYLILFTDLNEVLALFILAMYTLFIAIPGAYLGLDSIFAGARSVITGGASVFRGFLEFIILMIQGVIELGILLLNSLFGFVKGAFETVADYVVFLIVYIIFAGSIWAFLLYLQLDLEKIIVLGLMVLIPALLPASIAHRYWLIWRLNRKTSAG